MLIFFDVLTTLFSLNRIKSRFRKLGIRQELVELWFARLFQASMASTLAGRYSGFEAIAASVLKQLFAREHIPGRHLDEALVSLREVEPRDGAAECLRALRSDGHRLIALTDDGRDSTRRLLERAGLWKWFERLYSAEISRACKPHHAVYEQIFRTLFAGPYECCMVSALEWDIIGAESVGMNSVYVAGGRVQRPVLDVPASFIVASLYQVPRVISEAYGKADNGEPLTSPRNQKWFGQA